MCPIPRPGGAASSLDDIFQDGEEAPEADALGQDVPEPDGAAPHYLRYTPEACAVFRDWLETETNHLRQGTLGAAMESHCLKYRKTVCALSLIFHIASEPQAQAVGLDCLTRALAWVDYLKGHARRVYGSGENGVAEVARRILERIRKGDLEMPFRAREVHRGRWSGLTDRITVQAALDMLVDFGWLTATEQHPASGRPTVIYDCPDPADAVVASQE